MIYICKNTEQGCGNYNTKEELSNKRKLFKRTSNAVIIVLLMLVCIKTNAQQVVKGIVYETSETGKDLPLPGANLYWQNTDIGTISNFDGKFELPYSKENHALIISYVGYKTDTLHIHEPSDITHWMISDNSLDEVVLKNRKQTAFKSLLKAQNITNISSAELLKAACCNLSESFETNPAIDVNFPDALTGTRQIKMLGLTSPYSLITVENIPAIRGASQAFGLSFVPGTWVESIQIAKGAGSVINGYESIAGQINVELQKPSTDEKVFVNAYASSDERYELNTHLNFKLNEKWYTGLYLHGNLRNHAADKNDDGFMDMPMGEQVNVMNRWQYQDAEKGWIGFLNLRFLTDNKEIGQTHISGEGHDGGHGHQITDSWSGKIETIRAEAALKIGYVFPSKPYESVGFQLSYSHHEQESHFGAAVYDINQKSLFSNVSFNSIIGDSRHTFKTGLSFTHDSYEEHVKWNHYLRDETSVGAYFEYAYDNLGNLLLTAGLRTDYHNLIGTFVTPRLHARYTVWEKASLKGSVGRGVRAPSIFTENQQIFASSRNIVIENAGGDFYGLDAEDAWNYGLSFLQEFNLFGHQADVSADFYHTAFKNQIVVDYENPREVRFYNLDGKSYANSFQTELNFMPFNRTDIRLSYRLSDVKTDYKTERLQKILTPKHRFFANAAYATPLTDKHSQWKFDVTYNWLSSQRFPSTAANPTAYQRGIKSPELHTLNAQVTKVFNHKFEIYVGGENITNVRQNNPIIAADDPFGQYFDTTLVYGPIFGSMYYAGLRWKL